MCGKLVLIRDRDSKVGDDFTRVAKASSIEVLKTPYRAPKANAICERFLGSLRRECLHHLLVVGDRQLHRVIKEYVECFNRARPHQGIGQRIPGGPYPSQPGRGEVGSSRFRSSMDCTTTTGALRESAAVRTTSDGVFG
jgi:transposase InsO family protein